MRRYRTRNKVALRGLRAACKGIQWQCDSRNACYGSWGEGSPWGRYLLRVECVPGASCKAEVLTGRFMIARKRGLSSMSEAKEWACKKARR